MPYIYYIFTREAEFTRIHQNLKHMVRIYSYVSLHINILHARNNLKRPACIYKAGNFVFCILAARCIN